MVCFGGVEVERGGGECELGMVACMMCVVYYLAGLQVAASLCSFAAGRTGQGRANMGHGHGHGQEHEHEGRQAGTQAGIDIQVPRSLQSPHLPGRLSAAVNWGGVGGSGACGPHVRSREVPVQLLEAAGCSTQKRPLYYTSVTPTPIQRGPEVKSHRGFRSCTTCHTAAGQ